MLATRVMSEVRKRDKHISMYVIEFSPENKAGSESVESQTATQ